MGWFIGSGPAAVFCLLLACAAGKFLYDEIASIARELRKLRHRMGLEKRWMKVQGRVRNLGFRVDYVQPPSDEELSQESVDRFIQQARICVANDLRHGGVLIAYEYEVEGRVFRSRRISPLPAHAGAQPAPPHLALFYRLAIGDEVPVWVDPRHPQRCCLLHIGKAAYDDYFTEIFFRRLRWRFLIFLGTLGVASLLLAIWLNE